MNQCCNFITKSGKRCKRRRKLHIARWLCWQHWIMYKIMIRNQGPTV